MNLQALRLPAVAVLATLALLAASAWGRSPSNPPPVDRQPSRRLETATFALG